MRRTAMLGAMLGIALSGATATGVAASHQAYYDARAGRPEVAEAGAGRVHTEFWSRLTPEQQTIHGLVTRLYTVYFERQGEVIPVDRETVALVMRELDIPAEHAEWTAYVMQVNVQRLRSARPGGPAPGAASPSRRR